MQNIFSIFLDIHVINRIEWRFCNDISPFLLLLNIISHCSYHCYFTDKAATKIQAVYRGHKVRVSMKRGDTSSKQEAAKPQAAAVENDPTKEELEAEFKEDDKGM